MQSYWSSLYAEREPNSVFETFHYIFNSSFNCAFPIKKININSAENRNVWITKDITRISCKNKR